MPDRTALVAGATGLVGRHLLRALLASPRYTRVVAAGRRPPALQHPRLEARTVDFDRLAPDDLPDASDCFCALGTTIKQAGSQEAFRQVDHDYVLAFAQAACMRGARQGLFVSATGATPESHVFYSRVKGETERDLDGVPFETLVLFRPSLLLGDRDEHRPAEGWAARLAAPLTPLMVGPLAKYRPVPAADVAAAMRYAAEAGWSGRHVVEGPRLHELARHARRSFP